MMYAHYALASLLLAVAPSLQASIPDVLVEDHVLIARDQETPCTFSDVSPAPRRAVCNGVGNLTKPATPLLTYTALTYNQCRDNCFNYGPECVGYSFCFNYPYMCYVGIGGTAPNNGCRLYNTTLNSQGFKADASTGWEFSARGCQNATCPATPAPTKLCPKTHGRFTLQASTNASLGVNGYYAYVDGDEVKLASDPVGNGNATKEQTIFYFGAQDGRLYNRGLNEFNELPFASWDSGAEGLGNPWNFYSHSNVDVNEEAPLSCTVKNKILTCPEPFYLWDEPGVLYGHNPNGPTAPGLNLTVTCASLY